MTPETYIYRILVTGSRDWPDQEVLNTALKETVQKVIDGLAWLEESLKIVIVHGAAYGADLQAEKAAKEMIAMGLPVDIDPHPVKSEDWKRHGKRAGYLRNKEMVDAGAQVCLAFIYNKSSGATMCADLAEAAGIPVFYFRIDSTQEAVVV